MNNKSRKKVIEFIQSNRNFQRFSFFNYDDNYFDFVFLCGRALGKRKINNRKVIEDNILTPSHKFTIYAEKFYEFLKNSYYKDIDLSTAEVMLLDISTAVVIILESAGSICELGAFSFLESNTNKALVINNSKYYGQESFIHDGPLKKLGPQNVLYCDFNRGRIKDFNVLKPRLSSIKKRTFTKSFFVNNSNPRVAIIKDLNYLTCVLFDYINLFGVLNEDDVDKILYLIFYQFDNLSITLSCDYVFKGKEGITFVVKCILYLLSESRIITKKRLGQNNFYYTINYDQMKLIKLKRNETSFIYNSSFLRRRSTIKSLSRLHNYLKQDGYILW